MNNHDKIFCHTRFLGVHVHCSSVEMLKGYMLMCRNAYWERGKKVANP